ncbi:hypothetical protein HDU97_009923 [Phlyctochytrium planicorne]|nr:hypothetical protein HDU97_009923 [Phlyctochytrium planicorne]
MSQWIPYTELFKNHPGSKVIQGKATSIDKDAKTVKLESGEEVGFDYLVIATGSKLPGPMKTEWMEMEDGLRESEGIVEGVGKAEHVALIGGGFIGVELAGEIASEHPSKKITIIHSGPSLLNTTKTVTDSFRDLLLKDLQALPNVTVLLNERVIPSDDGHLLPNGKGFHLGNHTIKTETGKEISSDVQFLSTGTQSPNSEFVTSLGPDMLDDRKLVKVRLTGQLVCFDHIFALGDVSDMDEMKMAYLAGSQGSIVGKNIITLITSTAPSKLIEYTKLSSGMGPAVVSMGPNSGRTQLPYIILGGFITKTLKSSTLLIPKHWKLARASHLMPKQPSKGWFW